MQAMLPKPLSTVPAARKRYELVVQPSPPAAAWHATLIADDGSPRLEFDTPEALAQHLRLTTSIERRRGLR